MTNIKYIGVHRANHDIVRIKNICKFLYLSRNIKISFHSAPKNAYNVDKYNTKLVG
jgi:hypothetical protein